MPPPPQRSSTTSSDGSPLDEASNTFELRPIVATKQEQGTLSDEDPSHSLREDDDEEEEEEQPKNREEATFLASRGRRFSTGSAQSFELYTPDEDRAVLKKLDRRLVVFVALLYCLSFLDRSNIGNARIAGLTDDLSLSSSQYEWLLRAFYITYIAFEWMTLMYRLVPPHVYISLCIFSWGLIASIQAVATSFSFLLVLRALLGISEAAFGPGVPFYLSFFFRRRELAFRTGLFISASPLSASFAGALAWLITKLGQGGPLSSWRLLFLIEGFPSVIVAVWAWDFIPDGPGTAKWLSPRQREVAVLRLRQEREAEADPELDHKRFQGEKLGSEKRGVDLREVWQTLKDPKCYLTAAMFFSSNVAFSSLPVFLPTILHSMGFSPPTSQALTFPPYFLSFAIVLLTAHLSDKTQSRSPFIILHSLLATSGYAFLAAAGYARWEGPTAVWAKYAAVFPASAGFFSCITIIITWTLNNQQSATGKGTGMAILNVIGQVGPLVGTSIFPDKDGPWFVRGLAVSAGFMLLVGVLAAVLRVVLVEENQIGGRGGGRGAYAGVPVDEGGAASEPRKGFRFIV